MSSNRILLVDDNKGQRVTLESILKSSGFSSDMSADCGNAALDAARYAMNSPPRLLDIKMPDLTGIDVLKSSNKKPAEMSIIMMTGYSETELCHRCVKQRAPPPIC